MRVTRFGNNYAGAYELPLLKAEVPQISAYRPIAAMVSGGGGEFDFYGSSAFPIEPKTLDFKAALNANTYAGITALLDELRAELMAVGRSKLWYETRDSGDDVPIRWAYAKALILTELGEVAGRNFTNYPVSIQFRLSEGLIYSQTQQSVVDTAHTHVQIVNHGTYKFTPVNLSITVGSSAVPLFYVKAHRVSGNVIPAPTNYFAWTAQESRIVWLNSVDDGLLNAQLDILSDALSVVAGSVNKYATSTGVATVTLGGGQVAWLTTDIALYDGPVTGEGQFLEMASVGGDNISAVANTTPIAVTSAQNHGLSTGDTVTIYDGSITNGTFVITSTGATTFTLDGTTAAGTAATGRWFLGGSISAITVGAPSTITTSVAHNLSNGDMVFISFAPDDGIGSVNGVWKVSAATATTFVPVENLTGSDYPAINPSAYTSGAFFYPSPGHTLSAEWYETWV